MEHKLNKEKLYYILERKTGVGKTKPRSRKYIILHKTQESVLCLASIREKSQVKYHSKGINQVIKIPFRSVTTAIGIFLNIGTILCPGKSFWPMSDNQQIIPCFLKSVCTILNVAKYFYMQHKSCSISPWESGGSHLVIRFVSGGALSLL